jgi:hypothetical protein
MTIQGSLEARGARVAGGGAGDGLVLAQVEGENEAGGRRGRGRGGQGKPRWGFMVPGDRDPFQATTAPAVPGEALERLWLKSRTGPSAGYGTSRTGG